MKYYCSPTKPIPKITKRLPEILPPILQPVLEKHEREKEAKEKSFASQIKRIAEDIQNPGTWFWMFVSAIVDSIVVLSVFGHP